MRGRLGELTSSPPRTSIFRCQALPRSHLAMTVIRKRRAVIFPLRATIPRQPVRIRLSPESQYGLGAFFLGDSSQDKTFAPGRLGLRAVERRPLQARSDYA